MPRDFVVPPRVEKLSRAPGCIPGRCYALTIPAPANEFLNFLWIKLEADSPDKLE